jgi:hypothetical protein
LNPYAAPKAKLEKDTELSTVWRQGSLVRIDREGSLPPRCVVCNQPCAGKGISRKLYWASRAWTIATMATPFVALGIGLAFQLYILAALFWPLVLLMFIAHAIVRKSMKVELGLCPRHQRARLLLQGLSIACFAAVFVGGVAYEEAWAPGLLWAGLVALLVLALVQRFSGIYRVSLRRLTPEHAWLAGTGSRFREALPELPG